MCGFLGIYSKGEKTDVNLDSFMKLINHRGPDSTSFYHNDSKSLSMGFARLSIIDLETGNQPVFNEDKSVVVLFNGEIYNYQELTAQLKKSGHHFATKGDSETIAHLYEEYGEEFLQHLEGMFAIVLWDEKRKILYLARDRFGIKPLYYYNKNSHLIFASEIKPILHFPSVSREFSDDALSQYVSYGYTLAPHTIFKDIKKVLPGHYFTITKDTIIDKKYWDLNAPQYSESTLEETKSSILNLFDRSIQLHLRSDVPLGAFLSGGIDSGLLVARATKFLPSLKTYTLKFADSSLDESSLASLVAERYETQHQCFTVESKDLCNMLPSILWYCDEPLADSGVLPNYIICHLAKKDGVRVVLSGAGGDELFAGYTYFFPTAMEKRLLKSPVLVNGISVCTDFLNPELARKLRRALSYHSRPAEHYVGHVTATSLRERNLLLKYKNSNDTVRKEYFNSFQGDFLNAKLYSDIKTYLTEDLMLLTDRTTMAHSLEGRVPFLHHPFVEKAMSIPSEIKAPGDERKWLLKEIAKAFLPEKIIHAPKSGFNSPINQWTKGPLGTYIISLLSTETALNRPWWNRAFLKKFVKKDNLKGRYCHVLFMLFMLEMFCRIHSDSSFNSPPATSMEDFL
ncbi:MAG: asparagine synthase (glutamine-hydrolyzing) [Candidatus Xenobiia bacterium LiM19]